jgi:nucleoside-diphosphate-sugar epimerase
MLERGLNIDQVFTIINNSPFIKNVKFKIATVDRSLRRAEALDPKGLSEHFSIDDLRSGKVPLGGVDMLIHLGSARPQHGASDIARSLSFSFELIAGAVEAGVRDIVFASSQSVYGNAPGETVKESHSPAPNTPYATHKLAVEQYLESIRTTTRDLRFTNLRISALSGSGYSDGFELVSKLISDATSRGEITVYGGSQIVSRLSAFDAAESIAALVSLDSNNWPRVLNLGSPHSTTLLELAELVKAKVELATGQKVSLSVLADDGGFTGNLLDTTRLKSCIPSLNFQDLEHIVDSIIGSRA